MVATTPAVRTRPDPRAVLAGSRRDAWLVAIAAAHACLVGCVVVVAPTGLFGAVVASAVALATVYTSNTVAHWHLHAPLFVSRAASRALSLGLTIALGIPQSAWKQRHLWHHAGEPGGRRVVRLTPRLAIELAIVAVEVAALAWWRPRALGTLVPGVLAGLALAWLQGRFEHAGDPDVARSGVSHYGRLYNTLWFNDGFHAEHHRKPSLHWTLLPGRQSAPPITSERAPMLRVLDAVERGEPRAAALGALERLALALPWMQSWLVRRHAAAMSAVLAGSAPPRTALVVGGGLFPRTVLVLGELYPGVDVVVVDASLENLAVARRSLEARGVRCPRMIHARFDPLVHRGFDLVVLPLAFVGEASAIARARSANGTVVTHHWIFHRARRSAVVSLLLLKRLVAS
jgi:hypothetical protein